MEVHHEAVGRGVIENIEVVADHRLPVAAEEVDFQSGHPHRFQPVEFLHAALVREQAVARRLRRRVPAARRVVPEQDRDIVAPRIVDQLLDLVIANLRVPERIDQTVVPAHVGRVVDELLLHFVGRVAIAEQRPAPRRLARRRRISGPAGRLCQIDPEHGFGNRLKAADHNNAPRREPGERRLRIRGAARNDLPRVRKSDRVFSLR